MSNAIIFTLAVQAILMLLTIFLLLRPKGFFGATATRKKPFTFWSGLFFLFLTFSWSVITGIVLAMNDLYLPWLRF
ncbi:MAG: hypothetical protein ABIQ95_03125 [Bdellovibrionia bacterium]